MAPKKKEKPEPEPEKVKLSRGDVDELIDDGTALVETHDWSGALAKLETAAEALETYEEEDGGQQEREIPAAVAFKRGGTPPKRERPPARSEKPSEAVPPLAQGGQP